MCNEGDVTVNVESVVSLLGVWRVVIRRYTWLISGYIIEGYRIE